MHGGLVGGGYGGGVSMACLQPHKALLISKQHDLRQHIHHRSQTPAALQVYRHIVLAVHHLPSGRYGALGLSRRSELMYKPLRFSSLAELVGDFKAGYERWWHQLLKVSSGVK